LPSISISYRQARVALDEGGGCRAKPSLVLRDTFLVFLVTAWTANAQQLVDNQSGKSGRTNSTQRETSNVYGEVTGTKDECHANREEIAWIGKVYLVDHQMRAIAEAIRPNTDTARPASTGAGIVCRIAPNFGDMPSAIATTAAITKISVE